MVEMDAISRIYTIKDCESKFLKLIGYQVVGPNGSNRYQILDMENCEVGYIQYKKLASKIVKKGKLARYGYEMKIDSPTIRCKRTRHEQMLDDNYSIYIKGSEQEDCVEIYLGEIPSIWSKAYGYFNFRIGSQRLFINFKTKTNKSNIEETMVVELSKYHKKYNYCVSVCDSKKDIEKDKEVQTFDITFNYDSCKTFPLEVKETNWNNGQITFENTFYDYSKNTLEEAIKKHKFGIDSFYRFRAILNRILPFQGEVVESILENVEDLDPEIALFIPNRSKEEQKQGIIRKLLKK